MLLTTCYVTHFYAARANCYIPLTTCYILLIIGYWLLATCYLLLATYYLLLATYCLLLATYYRFNYSTTLRTHEQLSPTETVQPDCPRQPNPRGRVGTRARWAHLARHRRYRRYSSWCPRQIKGLIRSAMLCCKGRWRGWRRAEWRRHRLYSGRFGIMGRRGSCRAAQASLGVVRDGNSTRAANRA